MTRRGVRLSLGALLCSAVQLAWGQACPAPEDITPLHLYGPWMAEVKVGDSPAEEIRVLFTKHPELAGSVSGTLERAGSRALIAGDVDHGEFTLEESLDGQRINATWLGQVTPTSCGKEITGTWTQENDTTVKTFVLRKQSGW
jgi:hypothetical protein